MYTTSQFLEALILWLKPVEFQGFDLKSFEGHWFTKLKMPVLLKCLDAYLISWNITTLLSSIKNILWK